VGRRSSGDYEIESGKKFVEGLQGTEQQTDPPIRVNPTERRGHKADGSKKNGWPGCRRGKREDQMKGLKTSFIVLAAALMVFGLSGMALAFHSGGVAECTGCHMLHDAKSTSALLAGTDISSTCINCHGATGASSASTW
jgi:predicted CXXCH cytochrome family protein